MAAIVEVEVFTQVLRERLASSIDVRDGENGIMAAFDRAVVGALFASLNGKPAEKALTPGQKAAATRKKNRAERLREAEEAAPLTAGGQ